MSELLFPCSKRKIKISPEGYCDWFDKKKNSLTKKCCSNCKHIKNNDKKTKTKIVKKTEKTTPEDETKTNEQ